MQSAGQINEHPMIDDWQAEQSRDECERLRQALEALEAAEKAGTPREALETLAYEAGVAEQYLKRHP